MAPVGVAQLEYGLRIGQSLLFVAHNRFFGAVPVHEVPALRIVVDRIAQAVVDATGRDTEERHAERAVRDAEQC